MAIGMRPLQWMAHSALAHLRSARGLAGEDPRRGSCQFTGIGRAKERRASGGPNYVFARLVQSSSFPLADATGANLPANAVSAYPLLSFSMNTPVRIRPTPKNLNLVSGSLKNSFAQISVHR